MSEKVFKALNEQVGHEFFSANLYLAIASYFENIPLEGMSKWFVKQAEEEREHGMKIYQFLLDRNQHVDLPAIEKPRRDFSSVKEAFEAALKHEEKVTHWIHQIYDLAIAEGDHATRVFMHWFIEEQVEEEKNAQDNFDQAVLAGDNWAALFVLDQNFERKAS